MQQPTSSYALVGFFAASAIPTTARLWDVAAVELERAQALFAAEILSLTETATQNWLTQF